MPANRSLFDCSQIRKSRPKIKGSPPKVAQAKLRQYPHRMWDQNIPNWYFLSSLKTPHGTTMPVAPSYLPQHLQGGQQQHHHHQQQHQQQPYLTPCSLGQQQYLPCVPQQPSDAYYYGPVPPQPHFNALHLYNATNIGQQQAWQNYQSLMQTQVQPQCPLNQSYSYWYQMKPQTSTADAGCRYARNGLHQRDGFEPLSRGHLKPNAKQQEMGSQKCHRQQAHSMVGNEFCLHSESGSLNRIDSITSFRNQQGLRIRDSEHDMIQYHRMVARNAVQMQKEMKKRLSTQAELGPQVDGPIADIKKIASVQESCPNPSKTEQSRPEDLNAVIAEALESRSNGFFHKLGLLKSSFRRVRIKTIEKPLKFYAHKKPNLFRRLFGDLHYPSKARRTCPKNDNLPK